MTTNYPVLHNVNNIVINRYCTRWVSPPGNLFIQVNKSTHRGSYLTVAYIFCFLLSNIIPEYLMINCLIASNMYVFQVIAQSDGEKQVCLLIQILEYFAYI
jgi:hypothetical protein